MSIKKKKKNYKSVRVSSSWGNNYTERESIGDRNKTLSVEEYLNKIITHLKRHHKLSQKIWHVESLINSSK